MPVSIDDLCETLGIKEIAPSDYTPLSTADENYATNFDGYALPTHRAIAPIVSKRLAATDKCLELGFGTGFRLAYYALNNPNTQFVAIDNDKHHLKYVQGRLEALGIRNVELKSLDMYTLPINDWQFPAVVAIDCIPTQVSNGLAMDHKKFRDGSVAWFAKMVDSSDGSFLAMTQYNEWTKELSDHFLKLIKIGNRSKIEAVPFHYTKRKEDTKEGVIIFSF